MNSYVIQTYPYQNVDISPWQKKFICSEEEIDRQMLRLANRHITWTEGEPVSVGDVVQCRLVSRLPRFQNDNLSLTTGAGLFDAELESLLIGKKAGDTIRLEKENTAITGTLISVKNRHAPAVTDEYIRELSIPDVSTVPEYRDYLREQQLQAAFSNDCCEPLMHIQNTVLEMSEILLRRADWKRYTNLKLQYLRGLAAFEGFEIETMTAKDFEGRIPVKSYGGLVAMLQAESWDTCCFSMLKKARLPYLWLIGYIDISMILANTGIQVTEYTAEMFAGNVSFTGIILPFLLYSLLSLCISSISGIASGLCTARIDRNLRRSLWDSMVHLPFRFYQDNRPKEMISRVTTDVTAISQLVMQVFLEFITTFYTCALILGKIYSYDLKLMLTLPVILPLQIIIAWIAGQLRFSFGNEVNQKQAELTQGIAERTGQSLLINILTSYIGY